MTEIQNRQNKHNRRPTDKPEVTAVEEERDEEEGEAATEEPAVLMGVAMDVTMVTRVGAEPIEDDVYKIEKDSYKFGPSTYQFFMIL